VTDNLDNGAEISVLTQELHNELVATALQILQILVVDADPIYLMILPRILKDNVSLLNTM
jgi:hypothetical protein